MGPDVRNPSAYITKAYNDRAHGKPGPMGGAGREYNALARRVEEVVRSMRLDDRASDVLRSGDPVRVRELLDSMPSNVRNPSAYIMKAGNDWLHQSSPPYPQVYALPSAPRHAYAAPFAFVAPVAPPRPQRRRPREDVQNSEELEARIGLLQLDEKAGDRLRSLEPMDAIAILESMDAAADVRNPSAFITKAVNDRLHGKVDPRWGQVDVKDQRWDQVSALVEELGLDERASRVLKELPAAEAYRVCNNLREKADTITNPSAYVLGAVNGIQRDMSGKRRRMV